MVPDDEVGVAVVDLGEVRGAVPLGVGVAPLDVAPPTHQRRHRPLHRLLLGRGGGGGLLAGDPPPHGGGRARGGGRGAPAEGGGRHPPLHGVAAAGVLPPPRPRTHHRHGAKPSRTVPAGQGDTI